MHFANIGDKVVCVDGKFKPVVMDYVIATPMQGEVYTIRDIRAGKTLDGWACSIYLLEEIVNPLWKGHEPGFQENRFIPLTECDNLAMQSLKEALQEELTLC